jgi:hypothetical protein
MSEIRGCGGKRADGECGAKNKGLREWKARVGEQRPGTGSGSVVMFFVLASAIIVDNGKF